MSRSLISESQVVDRDFLSEDEFSVASGTLQEQINNFSNEITWREISSNYTAVKNENLLVNTVSGTFTVTMYLNPDKGDSLVFVDNGGSCGSNYVTISGGVENMQGQDKYLYLNSDYGVLSLIYGGDTSGWIPNPYPSSFMFTLDQT